MRSRIEKDGDAEHLSYDVVKFEWQFKVQHFTKWGAGEEDEEMDSTAPLPAQAQLETKPETSAPQ